MKALRIHYLQHVPFEGPGYIETWANVNQHHLTATRFFEQHHLPDMAGFDWLVVMGGPMSVYDEAEHPWLRAEKEFIKLAIQANKTVVGICLGAQLIAEVSGAKVYPNKVKEIGWHTVSLLLQGKENELLKGIPDEFIAFHWHGETFDLPEGAINLMKTDGCINQAFLYHGNVLGLQLHLEATPRTLESMIDNCRDELVPGQFIQTEAEIRRNASYCTPANEYLAGILNQLANR